MHNPEPQTESGCLAAAVPVFLSVCFVVLVVVVMWYDRIAIAWDWTFPTRASKAYCDSDRDAETVRRGDIAITYVLVPKGHWFTLDYDCAWKEHRRKYVGPETPPTPLPFQEAPNGK